MLITADHRAIEETAFTMVTGAVRVRHRRAGFKPENPGQVVSSGRRYGNRGLRPRRLQIQMRGMTHLPASSALARRRRLLSSKLGEDPESFLFLPA